jgi:hypothetical protein
MLHFAASVSVCFTQSARFQLKSVATVKLRDRCAKTLDRNRLCRWDVEFGKLTRASSTRGRILLTLGSGKSPRSVFRQNLASRRNFPAIPDYFTRFLTISTDS